MQDGLYDWMTDKLGRDQFVIRAGDMSEVCWNDGKRQRCEEVRVFIYLCVSKMQLHSCALSCAYLGPSPTTLT
jgi:hypothetical protein